MIDDSHAVCTPRSLHFIRIETKLLPTYQMKLTGYLGVCVGEWGPAGTGGSFRTHFVDDFSTIVFRGIVFKLS